MCMERRRFSQTIASEWQTAFVVSKNAMVCLSHCRQKYNKRFDKLQDVFFKTKTKWPRPRFSFLSSRRLETETLVSRTTSRIVCLSFSVDPRSRHTFWTQTVGYSAVFVGMVSSNQMMVQRYMSVSSIRQAQAYVYATRRRFTLPRTEQNRTEPETEPEQERTFRELEPWHEPNFEEKVLRKRTERLSSNNPNCGFCSISNCWQLCTTYFQMHCISYCICPDVFVSTVLQDQCRNIFISYMYSNNGLYLLSLVGFREILSSYTWTIQEAQLMLTTGSTRLAVSRGQQTWYHSTCYI